MIPPMTEALPIPSCPRCSATHVVWSGLTHNGVPSFRCRGCGRRFIAHPSRGPVPDHTTALVRRRRAERLGLRAIARVTGVSRTWLQAFANTVPRRGQWEPRTAQKKSGPLIPKADELWSFVGSKSEVRWVWAALDADTRQVVAIIVGDRSDFTAECLWLALPDEYRDGGDRAHRFPRGVPGRGPEGPARTGRQG